MPPNTANNSSDTVTVRKKGQTNDHQQAKDSKTNAQFTKSKGLHPDFRISIGIAAIACLIVLLSPTILKQLAQLKRSLTKVPIDSRPIGQSVASSSDKSASIVDPDTGVEYEYHQFMATVEQHFPNVR